MTAPRLLLVDLGGVLENATFDRLGVLLPEPADVAALKTRWPRSPAVRSFELGLVSPAEFANAFDSPLNVDAVSVLGLRAPHVDGFAALERVLDAEGLLS